MHVASGGNVEAFVHRHVKPGKTEIAPRMENELGEVRPLGAREIDVSRFSLNVESAFERELRTGHAGRTLGLDREVAAVGIVALLRNKGRIRKFDVAFFGLEEEVARGRFVVGVSRDDRVLRRHVHFVLDDELRGVVLRALRDQDRAGAREVRGRTCVNVDAVRVDAARARRSSRPNQMSKIKATFRPNPAVQTTKRPASL